ncbi:SPW repeat domain-containing protein [Flavobacterium ustbae]|uniref:SPW repeat domain-containing protein n=1 Tax=Flavobacterium ustbae TaxID=2488790 RepID=UPI000F7B308E|nr:hypothetical protein [Flavobacterium ustbae]
MKLLTARVQGFLDYLLALLLFFMPTLLHLEANTVQSIIFYLFGIFIIFLSLQTDYKAGVYKLLPMEVHIYTKLVCGLFFAFSPWIFNFANKIFLPYLFFGGITIFLAAATKTFTKRFLNFRSIKN